MDHGVAAFQFQSLNLTTIGYQPGITLPSSLHSLTHSAQQQQHLYASTLSEIEP